MVGILGIVPAGYMAFRHQFDQLALAQDGMAEVEAGELDLLGVIDIQGVQQPVVEGAVVLELQGAYGMGDALYGVGLAVGKVVGGIDAPLVAGAVVGDLEDAVDDRVAHVEVGGRHVYPGAEHVGALVELPLPHPLEQGQVFLNLSGPGRGCCGPAR